MTAESFLTENKTAKTDKTGCVFFFFFVSNASVKCLLDLSEKLEFLFGHFTLDQPTER